MNVRSLRRGEEEYLWYAGFFRDGSGEEYILTNPQADCIAALWSLRSDRNLQLEYLRFIFLYTMFAHPSIAREVCAKNPSLADDFSHLSNKFYRSWYTNAQYVLIGDDMSVQDLHTRFYETGFVDLDLSEKIMDDIDSWEIALRHHLDVKPGRNLINPEPDPEDETRTAQFLRSVFATV
jgi:hypothetical protein